MARLLWCLHIDCQEAYLSEAGKVPDVCPACNRPQRWTTEPPPGCADPFTGTFPPPKVAYELTDKDRRFLRVQRIKPE